MATLTLTLTLFLLCGYGLHLVDKCNCNPPPQSFIPESTPPVPPGQILVLNLIVLSNHNDLPESLTLFVPLNQSIAFAFPSRHARNSVSYHIASRRLTFADLLALPLESPLPTLLPHHAILLSPTSKAGIELTALPIGNVNSSISVDGQEIIAPDLYLDDSVAVHGIRFALDPRIHDVSSSDASASFISPFTG